MSKEYRPNSTILLQGSQPPGGEPGRSEWVRGHPRRGSRALLGALAAIAATGQCIGRSAADEGDFHVSLRYRVDSSLPGCWDEGEFRNRIARRLGYDPFREDASTSVLVHVDGSASAIGGQVEWRNANGTGMGERRFVARDGNCAKLLAEITFSVGLEIELLHPATGARPSAGPSPALGGDREAPTPLAATKTPPPAPSSSPALPSPSPSPSPPPTPSPHLAAPLEPELPVSAEDHSANPNEISEPATPEDRGPHWAMWVGLGPSLAWGISPSTAATARLFLGVRRNHLSIEIGAEASYPSKDQKWDGSGFRQVLIGGSAGLCGHHSALAGCVLAKASELRVEGLGLDLTHSPTAFIAQAGLRLAATVGLGKAWFVTAHLDGLVLLTPCTVELNDVGVWEMPRVGALAGIDLAARFW
jgi:hypothetical protein